MDSKIFVIYMAIQKREEMIIDLIKKVQIETQSGSQIKAQVGALLLNKALTKVLTEYFDYSNVFSAKNAVKLLENTQMNEHAIKLEEDKQPLFRPIYSLGPVLLETLKIYIETNLANGFICLSKSPTEALILFDKKLDRSLRLCVDYWGLNNITIIN